MKTDKFYNKYYNYYISENGKRLDKRKFNILENLRLPSEYGNYVYIFTNKDNYFNTHEISYKYDVPIIVYRILSLPKVKGYVLIGYTRNDKSYDKHYKHINRIEKYVVKKCFNCKPSKVSYLLYLRDNRYKNDICMYQNIKKDKNEENTNRRKKRTSKKS